MRVTLDSPGHLLTGGAGRPTRRASSCHAGRLRASRICGLTCAGAVAEGNRQPPRGATSTAGVRLLAPRLPGGPAADDLEEAAGLPGGGLVLVQEGQVLAVELVEEFVPADAFQLVAAATAAEADA